MYGLVKGFQYHGKMKENLIAYSIPEVTVNTTIIAYGNTRSKVRSPDVYISIHNVYT